MARHDLLLVAQRPVALLPLAAIGGDLGAPVLQRLLQPHQLAHLPLDLERGLGVVLGERSEGVGAVLRGLQVGTVRLQMEGSTRVPRRQYLLQKEGCCSTGWTPMSTSTTHLPSSAPTNPS